MSKYTSFLVCFHPGHSDLYINGVCLGIVKDEVELNKVNPLGLPESNFKNLVDLRAALNSVLEKVETELNKREEST